MNILKNLDNVVRRIKQKVLYQQIFEYLESDSCKGDKIFQKEWLLELVCHTKAKSVRGVTFKDLMDFSNYVFRNEASEYRRIESIKSVRKFFRFCIHRRYCSVIPDNIRDNTLKQPDENDIMELMTKIVHSKPGPMPDVNLIRKIRNLKNSHGLSFRQIVEKLQSETGKKYYVANIFRLYHNVKVR